LNYRPVHLSEAVKHCKKYSTEDINIFMESEIAFDLNSEVKRVYSGEEIKGKDLLQRCCKSMPHYIEEGEFRILDGGQG
jgi:hypothetical protein